jgi:hypothetical protein
MKSLIFILVLILLSPYAFTKILLKSKQAENTQGTEPSQGQKKFFPTPVPKGKAHTYD